MHIDQDFEFSKENLPCREDIFKWYIESIIRGKSEGETLVFEDFMKAFITDWDAFKSRVMNSLQEEGNADRRD